MKQITTLLLFIIILCVSLQSVFAQNVTTSVQGVLRDPQGRSVDDGTYELLFKLYTQATGGAALWEETQSNVSVSHGVFSVKLGAINPISNLNATQTYYLGVTAPGAGELLPRVELTKSFAANTAASVTGLSNVVPSEGNVGIGTTTPVSKLEVLGDVKISSGGKLYFPDNTFLASAQSGTAEQVTASGDANINADNDNNGSGSIILKTGASEKARITNSGNMGIGTTNPSYKLDVAGHARVQNTFIVGDNSKQIVMYNADNLSYIFSPYSELIINHSGNNTFMNTGGGNVGIGTTNPTSKLTVAGAIQSGQSSGDALFIGDDSKLVDINVQNVCGLFGVENPAYGGFRLGNAGPYLMGSTNYLEGQNINTFKIYGSDAVRTAFQLGNTTSNRTWEISTGGSSNPWQQGGPGGLYFYDVSAGASRMFIDLNGSIYRNDGQPFFNNPSDRRVKKDIAPYKDGLDLIKQLNPVKFKYNGKAGTQDDGKEHVSFIAQDIDKIPELASLMVSKSSKKLEETDASASEVLSLNTSALQFILVNAIKEQQKQIEELKAEIQELKKK